MKPNLERNHAAYVINDPSIGSKLEPFMKLNSKRSETESRTQQCNIRDQNDPSIGSKLADMKQNSKRGETESGTQPSIAIEMIRVLART